MKNLLKGIACVGITGCLCAGPSTVQGASVMIYQDMIPSDKPQDLPKIIDEDTAETLKTPADDTSAPTFDFLHDSDTSLYGTSPLEAPLNDDLFINPFPVKSPLDQKAPAPKQGE